MKTSMMRNARSKRNWFLNASIQKRLFRYFIHNGGITGLFAKSNMNSLPIEIFTSLHFLTASFYTEKIALI